MKTLAITDRSGRITGLVRFEDKQADESPQARLAPLDGQEVHEIQLPPELETMASVLEIYETIQRKYALDRDRGCLTEKTVTEKDRS